MTKRSEALPGSRPLTRAESLRLQLEGSSSWDRMVAVANRSAVLRCPDCGRTGTWEDTPERRRVHLDAIPTKAGREAAGSDVKAGAKVHAAIGQEWRCSACKAPPTRDPKVGRIGSVRENTQTGKGPLVNDTNSAEDAMIDLCDVQLRRWTQDGLMSERDDNAIQGLPPPSAYRPEPEPDTYQVGFPVCVPTCTDENATIERQQREAVCECASRKDAEALALDFATHGPWIDQGCLCSLRGAIADRFGAAS